MKETYKFQPNNPVDFLAKWLLNHNLASVKEDQVKDDSKTALENKEKYEKAFKDAEKEKEKAQEVSASKEQKIKAFHDKFKASDDLEDHLQELSEFITEHTDSTTCYIGKLTKPKKPIDDEADDTAHIDEEALEQIEIIHASPAEYQFLVGKTIKANEGVTHRLFGTTAEGEGDEPEPPAEEGEGDEKAEKDTDPKHIFIDQVVREKKIKFFKVPRLGSYLAIRLSYNSCLSEKAIEEAIADKIEVERRREEQEAERKQYEEEAEADRENKEDADNDEIEEKVWEEIKEKDYLVSEN